MKGKQYKTPDGHIVKVLDFDEINKMAYINVEGSRHRWVHEPEYSKWEEFKPLYVPDSPMEMIDQPEEMVISSGEIHKFHVEDKILEVYQEPKIEENAIQINSTGTVGAHIGGDESIGGSSESIGMGSGEQGEEPTQESNENTSEEETVKPKRKRITKAK